MTAEEFYQRLAQADPIALLLAAALLRHGVQIGDKAPNLSIVAELWEAAEQYPEHMELIVGMAVLAGRTKNTPFGKTALKLALQSYEALAAEGAKG